MCLKKILLASIVLLFILAFSSCKNDDVTEPTTADEHDTFLLIESGNNQKGNISEALKDSVIVKVVDKNQNPKKGIDIYFTVISGEGSISSMIVKSNSLGKAAVAWTLGRGHEQILKVKLNEDSKTEAIYAYANNHVIVETKWIKGIGYTAYGINYKHDDRILESNHFLTFSDGSSDDVKIAFSKMAEECLYELKQAFNISSDEEIGLSSNTTKKIKIFSIKNEVYDQIAFLYGFLLYGKDSQQYQRWQLNDYSFRKEVKHEMTHIIEFLLGMDPVKGPWPDTWFAEGLAEYASGNAITPITTYEQWKNWLNGDGHFNPIKIHIWGNFTVPYARTYEFYPAFNLAVKYLMDSKGLGKSYNDIKLMIKNMRVIGFEKSFEKYMGITVYYYEENFDKLITEFLRKQ